MTSKPAWGNTIGAWAAESERADEEEKEAAALAASKALPPSFPSLKDSVTAAGKQKKKTKMSLQEFTRASTSTGLTPQEMLRLPTRPLDRSGDDFHDRNGLGGGFSNYGGGGGGRRGYGGGFGDDDHRRGGPTPRVSEFDQMPSRADEADNWGSMKKGIPSYSPSASPRPAPGGGGGFSKADEVDNWGSMKKSQAPPVSGFRNEMRAEPERWTRNLANSNEEPERLVIVKVDKPNPFGAARPREEVLTEKGVDWKKLDEEIQVKKVGGISRPTSSHSSRPGSSQSLSADGAALQPLQEGAIEVPPVQPKPKVNPFGDAKPREVSLAEKGVDYKKIDLELEHKRIDRPETDEEKNLKEEIENLKKDSLQKSDEEQANSHDEIIEKENALELLIRELDDKIRFGQKNIDRPGSGSGRYTGPRARLSSQPGLPEEPRGAEYMDRPRSRGTVESWPKQNGDRRTFSGGRDRGGYSGVREFDRSSSRSRW